MVRGEGQGRVVDGALHLLVVVEDDRGSGVAQQVRLGGDVLDDRAVGAEVAAQDGHPALLGQRVVALPDDVGVVDERPVELFAHRGVGDGGPVEVEYVGEPGQESRQPSREVEVLHQVLPAGPEVGEDGHGAGDPVEVVQGELHPGAGLLIAMRWMTALVDPPSARTVATASS